jgi:hypothetical protein
VGWATFWAIFYALYVPCSEVSLISSRMVQLFYQKSHQISSSAGYRGCQIFLRKTYQNGKNIPNYLWLNIPNGHKIGRQNGHKIYQHLPLKDPPKFTQIWIIGLKTNHLATLIPSSKNSPTTSWLSSAYGFDPLFFFYMQWSFTRGRRQEQGLRRRRFDSRAGGRKGEINDR